MSYLEVPDPPTVEPFYLRVADIRQYAYCPRILYYAYCLPDVRPITYKMEEGELQHQEEKEREKRRGLRLYGLTQVEDRACKRFDVDVESERLRLRGRLDMVIEVEQEGKKVIYPVEFKATRREPGPQYRLQLAAYALLLEEQENAEAKSGFYLLVPLRKVIPVRLDKGIKEKVERVVMEMHRIVQGEAVPEGCGNGGRCAICEFRRFCNDVL
ncbi:MAG: CRISPR-associated protein Cas4 [Anaerolineae bacterium]